MSKDELKEYIEDLIDDLARRKKSYGIMFSDCTDIANNVVNKLSSVFEKAWKYDELNK